jgi:hypothetical protein
LERGFFRRFFCSIVIERFRMNPTTKNAVSNHCEICDFICSKKSDYTRHLMTAKHINRTNQCKIEQEYTATHYECKKCLKLYHARNSLWYHERKCVFQTEPTTQPTHIENTPTPMVSLHDIHLPTNLILELIKQNQEFKQLVIDQSKVVTDQNKQLYEKHEENIDLQKQLLDVAKNSQVNNISSSQINSNNTISNSNNNNKTFNLNFFLNETCKDAMNMKDFIKSLEMSFSELEKMGEVGFAEGMSRLFVDRLNKLDITKRPIHCSDIKREIVHIKDDNKWERDNANLDRLRKIIKQLTIKNILRVDDWKKANAGCTEYNSRKNGQYLKIHIQALGPVDDDEVKRDFGKIIRRVAETTAIDKKYLCG